METTQEIKKPEQNYKERIVRILSKDIEGAMTVYSGLTKIKGVSWSLSNAVCKKLGISKNKKVGTLNDAEIKKITEFLKNPDLPVYLKNRQKDFASGEDKHLVSSDLELQKEFDIKRLRQMGSYRGFRHAANLPLRGQRTRSNFRRNRRKGAGIKKKQKVKK
ncbi:MAG: 30S ribosomal protein S13 [Candidatus Pacearchaeota archaeon]|jgi:small subunit ribosomal protein S13